MERKATRTANTSARQPVTAYERAVRPPLVKGWKCDGRVECLSLSQPGRFTQPLIDIAIICIPNERTPNGSSRDLIGLERNSIVGSRLSPERRRVAPRAKLQCTVVSCRARRNDRRVFTTSTVCFRYRRQRFVPAGGTVLGEHPHLGGGHAPREKIEMKCHIR